MTMTGLKLDQLLQRDFDALLSHDFCAFSEMVFATLCPGEAFAANWHLDCLAWHLGRVARGERVRLVINLPPRYLKSLNASIALPAWLLGRDPTHRIICVSYSDDLARKHARDCRAVVEAGWYRRVFPGTRISPRKNTESEFATSQHGFRLATSTGGTLTGRGGDVIIIDDPIKPADAESLAERHRVNEWYDQTLYSRLDNKKAGAIILVMQRLHQDDLTGHLIEKGGFEIVSFPAIATENEAIPVGPGCFYRRREGEALHAARESLATLAEIKCAIGSRAFAAQYQQAPVPAEGNLFKAAWISRYTAPPSQEGYREIVQSWDTASKMGEGNDYSVCTTWMISQNHYHLLDVRRERLEFPDLLRAVSSEAERFKPRVILIEDSNSGTALIQSLRQATRLNVISVRPGLDKMTRAQQQMVAFEAGRVLLPEKASWLASFEEELLAFPNGRHDDQVDSAVQFLQWATQHDAGIVSAGPLMTERDTPIPWAEWDARMRAFGAMPDFCNRQ